jgi:hypothetical protein
MIKRSSVDMEMMENKLVAVILCKLPSALSICRTAYQT